MVRPLVTVAMVSYKRPKLRNEAIKAIHRKPGLPFEFLHWKNDKQNLGMDALRFLFEKAQGKYFVVVEDDMIWFQDNWLKNLVEAFEQKPGVPPEGLKMGVKDEWGCLATNCLTDDVNNGGMWPELRDNMYEYEVNGITYQANIYAGGGAIIYNHDVLEGLGGIWDRSPHLNGTIHRLHYVYQWHQYPTAILRDTYIYHAASPYWNELYRKVWEEKQDGQTIENAKQIYSIKGRFNWENKTPMKCFLNGTFEKYAKKIHKMVHNGR